MKAHFRIRSLIVKTISQNGKTIHRHFFEWYERSSLEPCYVRLTLIRQNGTTIGEVHNIKFPKVKLLGTIEVKEYGENVSRPHYDASTYFYVDADEIAIGYDFYTATLTKKSDPQLDAISLKREDLRLASEK